MLLLFGTSIAFGVGFLAGKLAAARRMSRWLGSLAEGDQIKVRTLLRNGTLPS
jgi:hypothetical protein